MSLHPQLEQIVNTMLPFVKEFHEKLQLAPHAASMTISGEILGSALVIENGKEITVEYAIKHFEKGFRKSAEQGEIIASAIFFHGIDIQQGLIPATSISEAASLVIALEHHDGQSFYLAIPYDSSADGFIYNTERLINKEPAVFLNKFRPWWKFW